MQESYYLVDHRFGVQPLTSYLSKTGSWADKKSISATVSNTAVVAGTGGPVLPLTQDGQLNPGVLYPSSGDANERFYLPAYQLTISGGRYTTSLKWRGPADDPNGPLAFLTVEVSPVVPPLREPSGFMKCRTRQLPESLTRCRCKRKRSLPRPRPFPLLNFLDHGPT